MGWRTYRGAALGGLLVLGLLVFLWPSTPEVAPTEVPASDATAPTEQAVVPGRAHGPPPVPARLGDTGAAPDRPVSPGLQRLFATYGLEVLDCPEMLWVPGTAGPAMYNAEGRRVAQDHIAMRALRKSLADESIYTYPAEAMTMISRTPEGGSVVFSLSDGVCTRLSDEEAYDEVSVTVYTADGEQAGDNCIIGGCGISGQYHPGGTTVRVLDLAGCEITAMSPDGFAYAEYTGEAVELTLSLEGMSEFYEARQPSTFDRQQDADALLDALGTELEPEVRAVLEGIARDYLGYSAPIPD